VEYIEVGPFSDGAAARAGEHSSTRAGAELFQMVAQ
jgi:hypothetical protein